MDFMEKAVPLLEGAEELARSGESFALTVDGLALDGYAIELDEGLSQVPVCRVSCAVARGSDSDALLGKAARVDLKSGDYLARGITGIVTSIDQKDLLPDGRQQWVLEIHSGLIRLSLRQRWRVVHRQSVVDIVESILRDHGLHMGNRLTRDYPNKPWTAQVGETDLAFMQRLLAHADIWFTTEPGERGEVIVLADSNHAAQRASRVALPVRVQSGAVRTVAGHAQVALEGVYRRASLPAQARDRLNTSLHLAGPVGDVASGQWLPVDGLGPCLIIRSRTTLTLPRDHQGNDPQPLHWEAEAVAMDQPFRPAIPAKPDMPLVFPARVESTEPYSQLTGDGLRKARIAFDEHLEAAGEASPPLRQLQPFGGPPARDGQPSGWDWPLRNGADVLLTCLNDDPDQPLILGYAPCATQPGPVASENRHQHKLMTPAGHQFVLDDKRQAEAITLHTPDGLCLLKLDANSESPIVKLACELSAMVMRAGQNQDIAVGKSHRTGIGESQTTQVAENATFATDTGEILWQSATQTQLCAAQNLSIESGADAGFHAGHEMKWQARQQLTISSGGGISGKVGADTHLQASGAVSLRGQGNGDITLHQGGGGITVKADGTVRIFGNNVSIVNKR